MSVLICGSYAFDSIMVFEDRFKNHILPDQVHILNVCFMVPEMRREFGGCAGNIAYSLKMLGGDPLPMATVGQDFASYREWLGECGVDTRHIKELSDAYTAQAFITTDLDDNQITAFHPGAMARCHENSCNDASDVDIAIVAPDGRDGMFQHARELADKGIPFIFDPGQGMPMFDGPDLDSFIDLATWVTLNDYESELMQERTGLSPQEIAERLDALIVTRGAKGCSIYTDGNRIDVPVAPVSDIVDPTGCGDAFRSGLLYGLTHKMGWEDTARLGSVVAASKIETHGTQNHRFTRDSIAERFESAYGSRPW